MNYNPDIHHRRSIRLKGYDYSQAGAYFITICVQQRESLLGEIHAGSLQLNAAGEMVQRVWEKMTERFSHTALDAYVVMPNHFHAIIWLVSPSDASALNGWLGQDASDVSVGRDISEGQAQGLPLPRGREGLGEIIGAFKSLTTVDYIDGVRQLGWPAFKGRLWQRNYWEHIIRDDASLERLRDYIQTNPQRWQEDQLHPDLP
ncbi:MAG: transposase [Anaerolineae bacterium]